MPGYKDVGDGGMGEILRLVGFTLVRLTKGYKVNHMFVSYGRKQPVKERII